jgi:hypothetical protein
VIVLDTNVLSALMQPTPEPSVMKWLNRLPAQSIWTTAITIMEVRTGLELMPRGKRHQFLSLQFERILEQELGNRALDFDVPAAIAAASLTADRQRAGKPGDIRDAQIAGIVVSRGATLATRNVRHFSDLETPVVNPWADED